MKQILAILTLALASAVHAQAVGQANHGHHGGGNSGALGASIGGHANANAGAGNSAAQSAANGGMGDCDVTHYALCNVSRETAGE